MLFIHGIFIVIVILLSAIKKLSWRQGIFLLALEAVGICQLFLQTPVRAVVVRPDYNEEEREYILYYREQNSAKTGNFCISVSPQEYKTEQLNTMAETVFTMLPQYFLAENESVEAVSSNLYFPTQIEGYPFEITWFPSDVMLVSPEGELFNQSLLAPQSCRLAVDLTYGEFHAAKDYDIQVIPALRTAGVLRQEQLADAVRLWLQQYPDEREITLPLEIEGAYIYGALPQKSATLLWGFLGVSWLFFREARKREEVKKAQKKYREDLLRVYPIFVNQMVLYLAAGMTGRTALFQVMQMLETSGEQKNDALHRELKNLFHEMETGVSEKEAYRHFGKRCGQADYGKLMSLLIQAMLVGGKGLFARMEELEEEAFIKRREAAKCRGEAASTKLLIPMIVLLAVVMLLLIVPGFYGMGM